MEQKMKVNLPDLSASKIDSKHHYHVFLFCFFITEVYAS